MKKNFIKNNVLSTYLSDFFSIIKCFSLIQFKIVFFCEDNIFYEKIFKNEIKKFSDNEIYSIVITYKTEIKEKNN